MAVVFTIFAGKAAATNFFIDFPSISESKNNVFFVDLFDTSLHCLGHGDPDETL